MENYGFIGTIDVRIDNLTPCLKDNQTGELVDTEVIRIRRKSFLSKYNKRNGWYTNWGDLLKNADVYALVLKGTVDIQGLVALKAEETLHSMYIVWMCTAPHNNHKLTDEPKYSGIGGHLFAIAGRMSMMQGFDGVVYGFAANNQVMEHYLDKLGAQPIRMLHQYHFAIFENEMQEILNTYTYELTDEEI